MTEEPKIKGWWSFLKALAFKPTWEFGTTGFFFTFLAVGTWWRDNFASKKWQERLDLKGLAPHWHPAWWVCIGLVVEILLIVRESHRLWLDQRNRADELKVLLDKSSQGDFPKVVISYQDHDADDGFAAAGDFPGNFAMVKNLSPDKTVFNIAILPFETPNGKAIFTPSVIDHIAAKREARVQPCVEGASPLSPLLMHSIGQLLSRSYKDGSYRKYVEEKPFAFRVRYDDGAGQKFEAECALLYEDERHKVSMGQVSYTRLT